MAANGRRNWRPTYTVRTPNEVEAGWVGLNQACLDWLQEVEQRPVEGMTDFDRGVAEGERRLAGKIIYMALVRQQKQVESKKSVRGHK